MLLASSLDQQDRRSAVENRVQRSLLHRCYTLYATLPYTTTATAAAGTAAVAAAILSFSFLTHSIL